MIYIWEMSEILGCISATSCRLFHDIVDETRKHSKKYIWTVYILGECHLNLITFLIFFGFVAVQHRFTETQVTERQSCTMQREWRKKMNSFIWLNEFCHKNVNNINSIVSLQSPNERVSVVSNSIARSNLDAWDDGCCGAWSKSSSDLVNAEAVIYE